MSIYSFANICLSPDAKRLQTFNILQNNLHVLHTGFKKMFGRRRPTGLKDLIEQALVRSEL